MAFGSSFAVLLFEFAFAMWTQESIVNLSGFLIDSIIPENDFSGTTWSNKYI